jgi:hypothetical protein
MDPNSFNNLPKFPFPCKMPEPDLWRGAAFLKWLGDPEWMAVDHWSQYRPAGEQRVRRWRGADNLRIAAILRLNCFFQVGPDLVALDFDERERDARKRLNLAEAQGIVPPTHARVATGGGLQAFWRLAAPATEGEIEAMQRALAKCLGADAAATGACRWWRLPGSVNWRKPRKWLETGALPRLATCTLPAKASLPVTLADFRPERQLQLELTAKCAAAVAAFPSSSDRSQAACSVLFYLVVMSGTRMGAIDILKDTSLLRYPGFKELLAYCRAWYIDPGRRGGFDRALTGAWTRANVLLIKNGHTAHWWSPTERYEPKGTIR